MMRWTQSYCGEPAAVRFARRHYSSRGDPTRDLAGKVGGPGRQLVLIIGDPLRALWITTWQDAAVTDHAWKGAWNCSLFRSEGAGVASELIREAVAATRWRWPQVPGLGMITFIDRSKVKPIRVRGVETWGYCYSKAGFVREVDTKGGLMTVRLPPERMPPARAPIGSQVGLWGAS